MVLRHQMTLPNFVPFGFECPSGTDKGEGQRLPFSPAQVPQ